MLNNLSNALHALKTLTYLVLAISIILELNLGEFIIQFNEQNEGHEISFSLPSNIVVITIFLAFVESLSNGIDYFIKAMEK